MLKSRQNTEDENWLPIADIMTGLFVVFLFIAIVSIQYISEIRSTDSDDILSLTAEQQAIINDYADIKERIYHALRREFKYDLRKWQASIDRDTLIFSFSAPEILFQKSSAEVTEAFKDIIKDFFPRYLAVLEDFFPEISEIRIEGHTSSEWDNAKSKKDAFLENMKLSQNRTQSVLAYCLSISLKTEKHDSWVRQNITANGFSSTRLKKDIFGEENKEASRRVEFKIYLDAEQVIRKIEKSLHGRF